MIKIVVILSVWIFSFAYMRIEKPELSPGLESPQSSTPVTGAAPFRSDSCAKIIHNKKNGDDSILDRGIYKVRVWNPNKKTFEPRKKYRARPKFVPRFRYSLVFPDNGRLYSAWN